MDENLRAMMVNLDDLTDALRGKMMRWEQALYALHEELDEVGPSEDATQMLIDAGERGLQVAQMVAAARAILTDVAKEVIG